MERGRAGQRLAVDRVAPLSQVIVQSGRHPTVLQQLCQLPFRYFSDPRLVKVLFPSLIAACYNNGQNKVILEQEMSCVLLAAFIQVPRAAGLGCPLSAVRPPSWALTCLCAWK